MKIKFFSKFGKAIIVATVMFSTFALFANATISSLNLIEPNGSEQWSGTQLITWDATIADGGDNLVSINLSTDGGKNYNTLIATNIDATTGSYLWDTTATAAGHLDDGDNYRIQITAGKTGLAYSSSNFTIDNTAPTTTFSIIPAAPNGANGWYVTNPTVTLNCTDTLTGCEKINWGLDGVNTDGEQFGNSAFIVIPDGEHDFVYRSTDNAGSVEDVQGPVILKIDTQAPDALTIASIAGDNLINATEAGAIDVIGTAEANSTVSITLSDESSNSVATTTTADESGNYSVILDVTTLNDGIITPSVTATDEAGNESAAATSPTATKDTVAEIDSITSDAIIPDLLKIGDTITFTLIPTTDEIGATVTGSYNSKELTWNEGATDGGVVYTATYTVEEGDADQSTTTPLQITGVTYTDEAGNTSAPAGGTDVAVGIDANTPTLESVSIISNNPNSSYAKVGDTVTLSFASNESIATPTVTIDGQPATVAGGPVTWTATYQFVGGENEGVIPFTIDFTDIAGNAITTVTSTTDSSEVTYDETAPGAPVVISMAADSIINNAEKESAVIEGTAEPDSEVMVAIYDAVPHTPAIATTITETDGTFSVPVDVSSLDDGSILVVVNATDAAGNTSPDTTDHATKDTISPEVSTVTTKDTNMNGEIDTVVIIFEEPMLSSSLDPSEFTIDGTQATNVTASSTNPNAFIFTVSGSNEVAGTDSKEVVYSDTGSATDIAGNPLESFSVDSIDAAGPLPVSAQTVSTTEIEVTFSEDLNGTFDDASDFVVAGHDVDSTDEDNGVVTLTLDTPMGTGDTPEVTVYGDGASGLQDLDGNWSPADKTLTPTDGVVPMLTSVVISSNNTNTTLAKTGDTVTLSFTSSEGITTPTVIIDGQPATAVSEVSANNWEATYVFAGGEPEGVIPFTIDFEDDATPTPNQGVQVTATDDSSSVLYDETAPEVDAGEDKEVNTTISQDATTSDSGSGIATWTWTQESGPAGGTVAFGSSDAEDTTLSADIDGTYELKLTVVDNAGNESSDTTTFIWDTTAPQVEWSLPYGGATGVATSTGTAKVGFYGGSGNIILLDVSKVTLKETGTEDLYSTGVSVEGGDGNSTTLNIDYSALNPNTTYRINVASGAVSDVAGNVFTGNFISYFTTAEIPAEVDTTAPDAPVVTTSDATVDANYYTITGTSADDGGQRIVSLYNGTNLAGTAVLAPGATNWTINAALTQDSANVFTATATDGVGNESAASSSVTITETTPVAIIPTVTLNGGSYESSYTQTEAQTRFADGLEFNVTNTESFTINGSSIAPITPVITAKTMTEATALGLHVYNVVVTSSTGNTANITIAYNVVPDFDDSVPGVSVTGISASSTVAVADDTFENGWSWTFSVTVPTDETQLRMKFTDFTTAGGDIIPAANNIRFYSTESSDANSTSTSMMITAADTYSNAITLDTDLEPATPGRQIKITVEMKVPAGSAGGSYSAQYGIKSDVPEME